MKKDIQKPSVHSDSYKIRSYEVDLHSEAKLSAICNYFQESAWNHAEALGIGYEDLSEQNHLWVLSRMTIEVLNPPKWGETIQVSTWPKGTDQLFALRDVLYKSNSNSVIARGTSGWLVIDRTSKRPQRLEEFRKIVPLLEEDALKEKLERLSTPKEEYEIFQREASYEDIDMNNHVNNVAYIRWIQDTLPEEFHKVWVARKLSINFLTETFFKDPVEVRIHMQKKEEGKNTLSLSGGILIRGKPACTARIIYGKR